MENTYEWKPTHIFPNEYLVSNGGQVKSLRTNKILRPTTDKDGYLYYVLCVNGERKTVKAHRLVAIAFIDNPLNKPAIDHINGNKQDNRVENLRWVTNKENTNNPLTLKRVVNKAKERLPKMYDAAIKHNFGRIKTIVYMHGEIVGMFDSQKLASEFTGVSPGKVSQCISGKKKSCKGYEFKEIEHDN